MIYPYIYIYIPGNLNSRMLYKNVFFIILFKQFNNKVIYPGINGYKKGMFKFIFGRRFFFNQHVHVNVNFEVGAIAF